MAWADDLPRIRAENEAWRTEHLPRLREREAQRAAARDAGRAALDRIAPADRAAIIAAYGGTI
ncbi:hypothetical protein M9979_12320 [Sphingomonas sp. RP10(2022)]|uniref:Uncharacterized protein n=1 Tax=Sphingomonas liriopis TaxID=2949094 RepID=A0A9X2HUC3_9SPHN|nr:hypothetical protein [Sphingomonas liriopis]MCP3735659.1 hypothetical protein [Sphingomonas liriopis]